MFGTATIDQVWEALGEIPVDSQEGIEEPFYEYPVGTDKYEIWADIEEHFNVSIGKRLDTGKW